jgi:hypothetical protein
MRAAIQNQRGGDVESSSPRSGCAMRFQNDKILCDNTVNKQYINVLK